jgi:hypothetical protein
LHVLLENIILIDTESICPYIAMSGSTPQVCKSHPKVLYDAALEHESLIPGFDE